jgi:hypothetical protein
VNFCLPSYCWQVWARGVLGEGSEAPKRSRRFMISGQALQVDSHPTHCSLFELECASARPPLRVAGALLRSAHAAPAAAEEDNPLPCECTDVDAREAFILPAKFTCW